MSVASQSRTVIGVKKLSAPVRAIAARLSASPNVEIVSFRGRKYAVIPLEDYERLQREVEAQLDTLRALADQLDKPRH